MLDLFGAVGDILFYGVGADALLQNDPDIDPSSDGILGLVGSGIGAFLSTLVVGAILVTLLPDYTEQRMRDVFDDPVTLFLYGFLALLVLIIAVVVLVITIIGILIAIPLVLVAYLAWAVGATIAFLAVGDRIVSHRQGWLRPLLVAAAINGALALTGIGGILSFVVGAIGFGAVLRGFV